MVISADGMLVTSAHVVQASPRGTATFTAGDEVSFEVVGPDRLSDLAVGLDGEPVGDVGELQSLLTERFIGRATTIGFIRDGRLTTCEARCAELR